MKTPGQLIREARLRLGYSQAALASHIGVKHDSQISRIERDLERLAYYHLSKVSVFLRIDFNELQRSWLVQYAAKVPKTQPKENENA